ncbi:uncharacterized protein CDAR_564801 [Caerostris darwini]|uniref:Uncharacterized protein n=1 Tax=Caerostris darwini TaxID=1538125 RepID=A0AAV4Q8B4_9ARAC|nr:uncharacterized protein CDAR_564801 [Caerostris darwini]
MHSRSTHNRADICLLRKRCEWSWRLFAITGQKEIKQTERIMMCQGMSLWQDDVPWDTWPSVHNKDKLIAMAINPMAYQKEIAVNKVALYNINVYESGLRHQVSLGDIMGRQRFATGCLILGEFEEKIP